MLCLRALAVLVHLEPLLNTFAHETDGDAYPLVVEGEGVQAESLLELAQSERAPVHGWE